MNNPKNTPVKQPLYSRQAKEELKKIDIPSVILWILIELIGLIFAFVAMYHIGDTNDYIFHFFGISVAAEYKEKLVPLLAFGVWLFVLVAFSLVVAFFAVIWKSFRLSMDVKIRQLEMLEQLQERGISSLQTNESADFAEKDSPAKNGASRDKLQILDRLKEEGLISDEEYENKKSKM